MTTKHNPATALPLKFLPDEGQFIVNARGEIVGEIPCQGVENDKAIGAYLVHAANAYPQLVEALRGMLPEYAPITTDGFGRELARALLRELGEAE